jgi:hypothetical protein
MQSESTIEPTGRRSTMVAKLLGVIRGDKYLAGAYPVDAPDEVGLDASHPKEG